jgi:hypothetical protein
MPRISLWAGATCTRRGEGKGEPYGVRLPHSRHGGPSITLRSDCSMQQRLEKHFLEDICDTYVSFIRGVHSNTVNVFKPSLHPRNKEGTVEFLPCTAGPTGPIGTK